MSVGVIVLITGVVLLLCLAIGVPIAFALGLASILGILLLDDLGSLMILATTGFHYGSNWTLTMLPLFVFMAEIFSFAGIAGSIYSVLGKWMGRIPGGIAITTVASSGFFAALSGSSTAGAAAIGTMSFSEMKKMGVKNELAAGVVAAGGTLGILIPPSGILIIYGILTEESIGHLFMAGIIPGVLIAACFSIYVLIRAVKNPTVAPKLPSVSWKKRLISLLQIIPALIPIFIIFGGLYTGVFTPTETAGVGAFVAFIYAAATRRWSRQNFWTATLRTVQVTAFVLFIIISAMTFGYLLARLGVPQILATYVIDSGMPPLGVLFLINILFLVLGCFLDPFTIMVLTLPILFPIITQLGFNPIWFGIMMTINMEMANITPPVGLNLYVVKSVSPPDMTTSEIMLGSLPFVGVLAIGIILLIIFPQIALWLPSTMG